MKTDYLIVGQGIAGTLLAHFLRQAGQRVFVVDAGSPRSATQVAAGLINPITGRRYVKTWLADTLLPFAAQTYRQLEQQLGISIYHPQHIIRTLFNHREAEDWLLRSGDPEYRAYILEQADLQEYAAATTPAYRYGEVSQSAQVDIGQLAQAYREALIRDGLFSKEAINYTEIQANGEQINYQDIQAKTVVFCEGAWGRQNPFFSYLPFGGAKGEILTVRIPGYRFQKILKHRVFIVPLHNQDYWIGATYDWQYADDAPTPAGGQFLRDRLTDLLKVPFEVLHHRAAIRPTVKDRRPFLGRHPMHPHLAIFNGLGTKGASLGPYWAKQMTDHLVQGVPLHAAVDIARWANG